MRDTEYKYKDDKPVRTGDLIKLPGFYGTAAGRCDGFFLVVLGEAEIEDCDGEVMFCLHCLDSNSGTCWNLVRLIDKAVLITREGNGL